MQRMAEFMEERARFIYGEQSGLAFRRLGDVEHIDNDRALALAQIMLPAKGLHPRAAALGRARKIIADEKRDMLTLGVLCFKDAQIRMIKRQALLLFKAQTK